MIRAPIAVSMVGDVDDLRLAGRVGQPGATGGEDRGAEDVLGRAHAREVQPDVAAVQPVRRLGDEVAVGHVHRRAERLQARGVQVEPARADRVAAGHGDVGLAAAGHERAEDGDRGAQRPDQVVVGPVADPLRHVDLDHAGVRVVVDRAARAGAAARP